jgi:hypothetical protein
MMYDRPPKKCSLTFITIYFGHGDCMKLYLTSRLMVMSTEQLELGV